MTDKPKEVREGQRIAKVMARAGLCSRRDAEAWIAQGRVVVNGKKLDSPAYNVSESDEVRVDGKLVGAPERTRLFLYNKPRGLVTTARDPEGRPTIFENLPEDLPRLVAVGRLDINTEGLVLLTNDGGLARVLELPATAWLRRYRVRAHGEVTQDMLAPLTAGITLDGVDYAGIEATLERQQGSNVWIAMGLREGKNREIKKVLEHLGLAVNRLIRISFGPFQLGELGEGAVAEIPTRILRDQLGSRLAKAANVDFDAPIGVHGAAAATPAARPAPPSAMRKPARDGRSGEGARPPRRDFAKPPRESFEEREAKAKADPKTSYAPKMRKHVSALRAQEARDRLGPRKRIERGATVDRLGREIRVERLLPAAPKPPARSDKRTRPPRDGAPSRGAKPPSRFEARPAREGGRTGEARKHDRSAARPERHVEKTAPRGEARPEHFKTRKPRAGARRHEAGDPSPAATRERRVEKSAPRGEAARKGNASRAERTRESAPPRRDARDSGKERFSPRTPGARPSGGKPRGKPGGGKPRGPDKRR